MLSPAVAEMLTDMPETVALFTGAVIETVGGVVSGITLKTVTVTVEVAILPAASLATALRM